MGPDCDSDVDVGIRVLGVETRVLVGQRDAEVDGGKTRVLGGERDVAVEAGERVAAVETGRSVDGTALIHRPLRFRKVVVGSRGCRRQLGRVVDSFSGMLLCCFCYMMLTEY